MLSDLVQSVLPAADLGDGAPATAVDPGAEIDGDLTCIRCQYNLRGLRGDGLCPECGLAVLATLRRNAVLSESDLRWLQTLRRGAYLLPAAMIVWAAAPFIVLQTALNGYVAAPLVLAGPRTWPLPFLWWTGARQVAEFMMLPALAALLLYADGIWLVAAQEPSQRTIEEGLTSRRLLRALAFVLPLVVIRWWIGADDTGGWVVSPYFTAGFWPVWAGGFALLDGVVHVLLFAHLRRLASRVLDTALVRETRLLGAAQTIALAAVMTGCFLSGVHSGFQLLAVAGAVLLSLAAIGVAVLMFAYVPRVRAVRGRGPRRGANAVRAGCREDAGGRSDLNARRGMADLICVFGTRT